MVTFRVVDIQEVIWVMINLWQVSVKTFTCQIMECEVRAVVSVLMMFVNLVCTFFPLAFGRFTAAVCSVASENCRGRFLLDSVADDWKFSRVVVSAVLKYGSCCITGSNALVFAMIVRKYLVNYMLTGRFAFE
jgi:hypothetical protein